MICDDDFISRVIRMTSERFRSGVPSSKVVRASDGFEPVSPIGTVPKSTGTVDRPTRTVRTTKGDALSDLLDFLGSGQSVPSQEFLVSRWNRPKQTVSTWMREWRRIGVIPSEVKAGRCKATVPRRTLVPA